ncbi:hypothetical protein [uncultured Clostridium sp.]|uniref:hypothetical protein n=1 Tax=uncultured Clostridium sp. TaxID=59620 RepID=UPI002590B585|nr:hypothetical protein [uncultured Clostridium sp.]MDU1350273.1 hypothetical protein [Clostridium argentinense]
MGFMNKETSRKRKLSTIIAIIAVILIIIGGKFYATEAGFVRKLNDFKKYFTENNQVEAHKIYDETKKAKHKEKIDTYLLDQLEALRFSLENNTIKNEKAEESIVNFKYYGDKSEKIKVEYNNMLNYIQNDKHYKNGIKYFEDKEFLKARDEFSLVKEEYKFYTQAQETLKIIPERSKEFALKKLEGFIKSGDFETALLKVDEALQLNNNDKDILAEKDKIQKAKVEYLKNTKEVKAALEKIQKLKWIKDEKNVYVEEVTYNNEPYYKVIEKDSKGNNLWKYDLYVHSKKDEALLVKGKEVENINKFLEENLEENKES